MRAEELGAADGARDAARTLPALALLIGAVALTHAFAAQTPTNALDASALFGVAAGCVLAGASAVFAWRASRRLGGERGVVVLLGAVAVGVAARVVTPSGVLRQFNEPYAHAALALVGAVAALVARKHALAFALWFALACCALAYATRPGSATLSCFVLVAPLCGAGLVDAHRRATWRQLQRRKSSTLTPPARERSFEMQLGVAALSALIALVSLVVVTLGHAAYERALDADRSDLDGAASSSRRAGTREAMQQWMHALSLGAEAAQRTDQVLATVALRDGRGGEPILDGRVLYFPVTTLDEFGGDRMQRSAGAPPAALLDEDDGSADGWIEFARPGRGVPLLTATVTQFTASTARSGLVPLIRLEPLLAVRIPELALLDDGTLLAAVGGARVEFALAADARQVQLDPTHEGPAAHLDRRYLALPVGDPALEHIAARAREIAADAGSDAERTLALVAHFRDGFTYSDEGTGAEGFEGLARLLERRSGYCASIAAACAVMLRSQGVPARAVAGLLGSEFDSERGAYVLRQRHGHAWVEAHFEGLGWVRLDPTPPNAQPSGAAPREFDPLSDWSESVVDGLASLVRGDSDAPGVAELAARVVEGPSALARAAREGKPLALALAGALLAAVFVVLGRSLQRAVTRVRSARSSTGRALAFEERLIEALRTRGAQVRTSRTLREIADSAVARIEPPLVASLTRAIRTLEAVRFGGEELEGEQRRELEALLDQLRPS